MTSKHELKRAHQKPKIRRISKFFRKIFIQWISINLHLFGWERIFRNFNQFFCRRHLTSSGVRSWLLEQIVRAMRRWIVVSSRFDNHTCKNGSDWHLHPQTLRLRLPPFMHLQNGPQFRSDGRCWSGDHGRAWHWQFEGGHRAQKNSGFSKENEMIFFKKPKIRTKKILRITNDWNSPPLVGRD